MKKAFLLLLVMLMSVSLLAPSNKTYKVVMETYPPYELSQNGKITGLDVEIIQSVFEIMGEKVVFEEYPWERCLKMVENGDVDAITSLFKTDEREKFLYFPAVELSLEENAFFTAKGSGIKFNGNLNDLKKYTIGMIQGYSYGDEFDNASYLKKDENTDNETLIKKVAGGRTDLGIGNILVINYVAKELGLDKKIEFLKPSLSKDGLYIGFSQKAVSKDFAKKFSDALVKFKKTSAYKNLLKKYGYN